MAISKTSSRAPCPLFAGRGLVKTGFTLALPYKTYLTAHPTNIASERCLVTVFNYDLAEYVEEKEADVRGFGVYCETGAYTDAITVGKHIYAVDFYLKVSEDYNLGPGQQHNCDVRAASIRIEATDTISGVVHGMYLNARLRATSGGSTFKGYYLAYTQTYGGIGLEVRTEIIGESAETTTVGNTNYGFVGILVAHKSDRQMTGEYAGIAIHSPLESVAIVGATTGIRFDTDGVWTGTDFDVGIDFANNAIKAINIDACTMAFDADVTLVAATNAVNLNVNLTTGFAASYAQVLQITMQTAAGADITGSGELHGLAIDLATLQGDAPYAFGETIYMATSGNPTIPFAAALSVYMGNMGTNCEALMILDLQMDHSADDPGNRYAFIRMRSHNSTYQTHYAILLEGINAVEKLLYFDTGTGGCLSAASDSTNVTHKVAVELAGVGTRYIRLFSD